MMGGDLVYMDNENKEKKLKYKIIFFSIVFVILFLTGLFYYTLKKDEASFTKFLEENLESKTKYSSVNPGDLRSIGFEYLDNDGNIVPKNQAKVVHIWNDVDDYYFNSSSGIQFTNHFNEYWTTNIFCAGYKDNLGDWIYDCNDALPFTWNIKTDNLTYVNITGWRDKSIGSKEVRLALRYSLELKDGELNIDLSVENIGSENITNDLGFAWRIKDIKINKVPQDDYIRINNTEYQLSENLDLSFVNLNIPSFKIHDDVSFINLRWDGNLNDKVTVKSIIAPPFVNGSEPFISQINAPITLAINAGPLEVGQQKTTRLFWRDPSVFSDESFDMVIYRGGTDDRLSQRLHNTSGWQTETTETSFFTEAIEWLDTDRHPTSEEIVMCVKDSGEDVQCQVWDGTNWGNSVFVSFTGTSSDPTISVCYEQVSGDALVFYVSTAIDSSDVLFAVWNGTVWDTNNLLFDITPGLPQNIDCFSDPTSDYIGVTVKDDDDDCWGIIWDGGSVDTATEVETECSITDGEDVLGGVWESSGNQFIMAYWVDGIHDIKSDVFTKGGSFVDVGVVIAGVSSTETIDVRLAADPTSDQILLLVADGDDDIEFNSWDGSAWGTESQLSSDHGGTTQSSSNSVFVAYESTGTNAIVVYGQGITNLIYRNWSGTAWSGEGTLATAETSDWIHMDVDPNSQNIMVTSQGTINDVSSIEWTGSGFEAAWEVHETAGNDVMWTSRFEYDNEIEDALPAIGQVLIIPPNFNDINITQNAFFNITINVSCTETADCGDINVTFIREPEGLEQPITISLSLDGSENLNDGAVFEVVPSEVPPEGQLNFRRRNTNNRRNYLMFDLSSIPADATIIGSTFQITQSTSSSMSANLDVNLYHVFVFNWTEGTTSWDNQTCGVNFNSPACNLTRVSFITLFSGFNHTYVWDTTNLIKSGFALNKNNISFALKLDTEISGDAIAILYSAEIGIPERRPVLNVTYVKLESDLIIPTTVGLDPFYTNSTNNPVSISLNANQSTILEFFVNATGNVGTNYTFFVHANRTADGIPTVSPSNATQRWNVTIVSDGAPPPDSCIYTSGTWNVDCSDSCNIVSDVVIDDGGNVSLTGTGTFKIQNSVRITGWTKLFSRNTCKIHGFGTGNFYQP